MNLKESKKNFIQESKQVEIVNKELIVQDPN